MPNGERITLDPITESTSNAPLELVDIDNGLVLLEHDYPTPESDETWSGSPDTEGERRGNTRPHNRKIQVKVRVAEPSDAASTNLITNPKAAVDLTGVANNSLDTLERVAALPATLEGADTAVHAVELSQDTASFYWSANVTNGVTYRFSAYVYLASLTATHVRLTVRAVGNSFRAGSTGLTTMGAWTRLDVSFTADATATWTFRVEQAGAGASNYYATKALLEQSASLTAYFDGDSAGCDWSGTRHASSSTRAATGGDRGQAILSDISKAVAKLNAEGGTYRRTYPTGDLITFDVESARITDMPQDKRWLVRGVCTVEIELHCTPYGRGAELDLGDNTETSLPVLIFTETGIKGDVAGLGRLVVDNDSANTKAGLLWGVRSRYYDSAATAALFFQAESCTLGAGVSVVAVAGASGGNVARHTALSGSVAADYGGMTMAYVGASTGSTHTGTYRVFVRGMAAGGNAGLVSFRLIWESALGGTAVMNPWQGELVAGATRLVDLGQITIPEAKSGAHVWRGYVTADSTVAGDDADLDYILLVPVDEGGGQAEDNNSTLVVTGKSVEIRHDGVLRVPSGVSTWSSVSVYAGDYLRVPAAGREARTVQIVLKFNSHVFTTGTGVAGDSVVDDDLSARLYYTPRYLVIPEN